MMAAITKELMHDFAHNRLDIDTRLSLAIAIEQLYASKAFNRADILFLEYYLRGYSSEEIAIQFFVSIELVNNTLARLLVAIEYASGNLDALFINRVRQKYTARQITYLQQYLEKHSKDFSQ